MEGTDNLVTRSVPRIDAHQHYWRLARGDYGWLVPALHQPIYRDFGPADLAPALDATGVSRTVLVQAAATDAETDYLLQVASAGQSRVAGVVGWTAMRGEGALERLATLANHPLLKGVRPMVQDIADPQWMLGRDLEPAFAALASHKLCFDALVTPVHLKPLLVLAERHPGLRLVIDHAAKPAIRAGEFTSWAADMRSMANDTSAWCKLSGLVTEADLAWSAETLRPYVEHLLEVFGPQRLLWGSDWPVVNLRCGYQAWLDVCEALLQHLGTADRQAIFGGNAVRAYGLQLPAATGSRQLLFG